MDAAGVQEQIQQLKTLVLLWQTIADNEKRLADDLACELLKVAPTRISGMQTALDAWRERRGLEDDQHVARAG